MTETSRDIINHIKKYLKLNIKYYKNYETQLFIPSTVGKEDFYCNAIAYQIKEFILYISYIHKKYFLYDQNNPISYETAIFLGNYIQELEKFHKQEIEDYRINKDFDALSKCLEKLKND